MIYTLYEIKEQIFKKAKKKTNNPKLRPRTNCINSVQFSHSVISDSL